MFAPVIALAVVGVATALRIDTEPLSPPSWAILSILVWLAYVVLAGGRLDVWSKRQLGFGIFCSLCFLSFLRFDPDFRVSAFVPALRSSPFRPGFFPSCMENTCAPPEPLTCAPPQGWGDVYYFCGSRLQYCTCNFRWNALGEGRGVGHTHCTPVQTLHTCVYMAGVQYTHSSQPCACNVTK